MTRIIIIRHGQSEANLNGTLAGQSNIPLTPLGHAQADAARAYLIPRERITAVYSSDLDRAYHTALPTAEALGISIIKDKRLREVDLGLMVGHRTAMLEEDFPEFHNDTSTHPALKHYPGGECPAEAYDRITECVCEIAERHHGETILIASHGGVIRYFLAYALGFSKLDMSEAPPVANTAISTFEWDGKKMSPVEINSTEHLKNLPTQTEE